MLSRGAKTRKLSGRKGVFIYDGYEFKPREKQVSFYYRFVPVEGEEKTFTERIVLPSELPVQEVPAGLIDAVLSNLHLMLGISYYKLYCPPKIELANPLTKRQATFWNTVYGQGLGEFFYRNNLDPAIFPGFSSRKNGEEPPLFALPRNERVLVGVGGGKDSIVTGELLKEAGAQITALVVETQRPSAVINAVVKQMGRKKLVIRRLLDEKLFDENSDVFRGHVPISGVYAWVGLLAAVLYGFRYVVVGNEFSSNFGNLKYRGRVVNHQWSKTTEFERLLQEYVRRFLTDGVTYFSLLRPFYEIRVAEMFSKYKKYWPYFSSCNRNFAIHRGEKGRLWCGRCAKCASTFVLLAAWLPRKELVKIFGENLLENTELIPTFENLSGWGGAKPFDCVATFEETRAALFLAREEYGEGAVIKKLLPKIKNPAALVKKVMRAQPALGVPTKYRHLGMKNVLILGYGKEGKVTERYLKQKHSDLKIGIADKKRDENYLARQNDFDLVIKTPGIAKNKVTRQYTTATNIFLSQVGQVTVGITGTKGKSTTAALLHAMLTAAGRKAQLLGNIGRPMLGELLKPRRADEVYVLEMSSYQLDDIEASPKIAVVLNLWPEHMNYHGSAKKYYQAKKNIMRWQGSNDFFAYNPKDKRLARWASEARAKAIPFSADIPQGEGGQKLLGEHNRDNIRAAATIAKLLNVPDKAIAKAVGGFKPLPHRLEYVGEVKSITFYDDAASTTPESTIQAIKTLLNVGTIFLGGEDRGYDFSELEKVVRDANIANVVLFPASGKRMFAARQGINILETSSMSEAVKFALTCTPVGKICLLSTASPSYSLWRDFEDKGQQFQAAIKSEEKKLWSN